MIKVKKIDETELAMIINDRTMIDYLDRLRMLATSLFTWKGLDEVAGTGASRFLEQSLYENGRACFVKDDELGFLALKVNPSDKLNVYNLPIKVMAWSIGYNKQYDFDDVVGVSNNNLEVIKNQENIFDQRDFMIQPEVIKEQQQAYNRICDCTKCTKPTSYVEQRLF